ncbi:MULTISPECIES: YajQ family cyclic di-GMP-binding protein [Atopobiaceae]|uniref:Nucleotide-binding protein SAMN05216446_1431 n=1 Tax=Parafannyhessea umbonata TaxID=604330 RepID=A0A1H9QEG4_9ACTN|nr:MULTISPECIES: YajQ family cyclic di-GMP-binding protein [Atopobiaceae]SEH61475.1 hypothetical protein SAMN05216447_10767 [Parafannyhessea umbonata]SER58822.1 hypothetical protein SAMN05216446_1431 [Parafannyhessea umbonata]SJZ79990.1 hypothetical protein SAMN06298223_1442 [Olsenella sp. KH1P3]
MAKESSFDIVSVVDIQEVDNAYHQASRELTQRYDLKQTDSSIEFSKRDATFKVVAPSEFVVGQVVDVLNSKLSKRLIDLTALRWDDTCSSSGTLVYRCARIVQGIDKETAKKISKDIRDLKLKCRVTVEGDKLRVSSASRDTLQKVISSLKERDYGQPLQFNNYR